MLTLISRWAPVALWTGLIFYLSSIPHLEVTHEPVGNFLTRKAAHLGEYAVLFWLIFRAQGYQGIKKGIIFTTLLGVTDEAHQAFVPSRTPLMTDILFDLLGASIGALTWKYLPTRLKKLKP